MGRGRSFSCLYRWAGCVVGGRCTLDYPRSSHRERGSHPQTSVLGLRRPSPSSCGHRLCHRHRRVRFVAVGLDSPQLGLVGLDIHCRWVDRESLSSPSEPFCRRRSHPVIIYHIWPVLGYLHQLMSCRYRCWGERVVYGRYLSLLDTTCRRQVECVVDGLWGGNLGTSLVVR